MFLRLMVLALAFAPFAARAIDRDQERTFAVQPGCTLQVELYRGAVDVQETDADEITVSVHITIPVTSEEKAERLDAALGLEMKQDGNTVTVHGNDPSGHGVTFSWNDNPPIDVDCKIFVPRQCNVEVRTHDGGITIGNLTGRVIAHAVKGNVFLRRIKGSADVATVGGDVILSRCSGDVVAKTERGTIRVGTLGSRAVLKNSQGDIEVLEAHSGLEASTDVGDIIVGFPNDFDGDTKIRTAYGSIFAKIDPKANCAVQASSFWGHVDNKLPLTIESGGNGKGKLTGRLNDGGPLVMLHANGGHVFLQRGDTYFN